LSAARPAASGGHQGALEIITEVSFPVLVNDPDASARLTGLFNEAGMLTLDPGPVTGSEDVGLLATRRGRAVRCTGSRRLRPGPVRRHVTTVEEARGIVDGLPSTTPLFAPVVDPTIRTGVAALTTAARAWLGSSA